jgi:asparagine synthetase B (glutamine-hydrolysing)
MFQLPDINPFFQITECNGVQWRNLQLQGLLPRIKSSGFNIKTSSDTEVLIKLYELYGLKMLSRLNGMFAFAIWDKLEKKLVCSSS